MKSNAKHTVFSLAISAAVAVGAAACGPSVPANPDWATDVLPVLDARCNRCHSAPPRLDPTVKPLTPGGGPPTPIGNFTDQQAATGLASLIISDVTSKKMPPAPAAPLDDWEIQMLKNFFKK